MDAPTGSEFARRIGGLGLVEREAEILSQISRGNVPQFWRHFVEVKVVRTIDGQTQTIRYFVSPEYLAIGTDADYFLTPVSPGTAQLMANRWKCLLPTRRMVDDIYAAAAVKLEPAPIPPSDAMTTVPVFLQHNETVRAQRSAFLCSHPLGALVAGHKKDVVLTPRLAGAPGKVAIYGWHTASGKAIQPLYLGHTAAWVDYSQGTRLVLRQMSVNDEPKMAETILADPALCALLSDEGPIVEARYPGPGAVEPPPPAAAPGNFSFTERVTRLDFEPGMRVWINAPAVLASNQPVRLVLYALPNGNTIEQTIGRAVKPGDDARFDIQHIGAQTRWLRRRQPDAALVVAYIECAEKSWPAWRRKYDLENRRIPRIVDLLRKRFSGRPVRLILTGHSGGGSFTFGYLNGVAAIPEEVERIAFLDSNYAYDSAQGHARKLGEWLKASNKHYLCVLAYHDDIALLDGKTFVSAAGGTWGRSHEMLKDLGALFPVRRFGGPGFENAEALDGRVKFFLKENPEKAVLHTRQVEWNGFIHALLAGTPLESREYSYFGPRVYDSWISSD